MPAKGQSLSRTLEATRRTLRAGPVWGRVGTAHENPRASSREVPTDTRQRQDLPGQNQQNEHRKRQEAPELISSMAPTEKGPEAGASWCTAASGGKRDGSATKAYRVLPKQLGAAESPDACAGGLRWMVRRPGRTPPARPTECLCRTSVM